MGRTINQPSEAHVIELKVAEVCTGNTDRSAMGAQLLQKTILAKAPSSKWEVVSAGTNAGGTTHPNAKRVMRDHGISLDNHRPRQVDKDFLSQPGLKYVLTMQQWHKSKIKDWLVEYGLVGDYPKVYTMAEFAGERDDVADPIGGSLETYKSCVRQLAMYSEKIAARLIQEERDEGSPGRS